MGIVCADVNNMSNDAEHSAQEHPMPGKHARLGYLLLAYTTTGLGIAGVFLPLLPTTPFLLVAVWWIYQQPRFARLLDDWQQQGAVPLGAKWLATAMMIASWSFLLWRDYHWGLVLGMSLFFMCIGLFLWTRPNPES
jgi:uncharacterized membrane protein YbaN (DUF454 family)